MPRLILKMAAGIGALLALAGCNDNKTTASTPTPTTPVSTARFSNFGTSFSTAFAASPNTEPVAVTTTDLPAVSTTTEPASVS